MTKRKANIEMKEDHLVYTTHSGISFKIDQIDEELLRSNNWYADKWKGGFYLRGSGPPNKQKQFHRLALGASAGKWGDHISGDTSDNRRCNLRLATPSENIINGKASSLCHSGVRGVLQRYGPKYKTKPWAARLWSLAEKRFIFLGGFSTKREATAAYLAAAVKQSGEFVRMPLPDSGVVV